MLDLLSNMTIGNPIFMIVFFGVIWYLPGIIIRRRSEKVNKKRKLEAQRKQIQALYPKDKI